MTLWYGWCSAVVLRLKSIEISMKTRCDRLTVDGETCYRTVAIAAYRIFGEARRGDTAIANSMEINPVLTLLVWRIGGGGAGHVRRGGNGGALPFGLRSLADVAVKLLELPVLLL